MVITRVCGVIILKFMTPWDGVRAPLKLPLNPHQSSALLSIIEIEKLMPMLGSHVKVYYYNNIQGVQMTTKKKLLSIKGLSEAKVDKIKVQIVSIYIYNDI